MYSSILRRARWVGFVCFGVMDGDMVGVGGEEGKGRGKKGEVPRVLGLSCGEC